MVYSMVGEWATGAEYGLQVDERFDWRLAWWVSGVFMNCKFAIDKWSSGLVDEWLGG